MPEETISRILEKLDKLDAEVKGLSERLAVHCAKTDDSKFKKFNHPLIYVIAGGLLAQGPNGIKLLMGALGIGGA